MKIIVLLSLTVFLVVAASSQQRSEVQPNDSAANRVILFDPGISTGKATLLLPKSLQSEPTFFIPPFLFSERAPGVVPPFLGGMIEQKADLISPLRLQMESEARLRTLRTVLGTVQVGGVVYMAYRRIKKYGLK
ncbi:MAG TPA: hypothetical protein DGH68_06830 [Bacteroidetes bacterium]|jgi:hypothetical protein|nr:hypothetical protein [Bacteroidota bacterium]